MVLCLRHQFDLWRIPDWLPEAVRHRYPEMKVVHLPDYDRLGEEIKDADIFAGWSLTPEQVAAAQRLQWIHCLAAGVNQLMRDDIRARGIVITNSRHVHAVPMAEHIFGLMLALARRLASALSYQRQRHWAQQEVWAETPRPMEVNGRTLLIVGYGTIGQELGRRARAFGMRVAGVKRDPSRGTEHADTVVTPDHLLDVLPEADFVVLAAPLTAATEHFFTGREFAAMKKTAYFINVSRGALVDADALVEALKNGKIAGAAIDVAEAEPLPPESALWDLPNLLITPHVAAVSERLWHRQAALWLDNLERYFAGRELLNVVDQVRGY